MKISKFVKNHYKELLMGKTLYDQHGAMYEMRCDGVVFRTKKNGQFSRCSELIANGKGVVIYGDGVYKFVGTNKDKLQKSSWEELDFFETKEPYKIPK